MATPAQYARHRRLMREKGLALAPVEPRGPEHNAVIIDEIVDFEKDTFNLNSGARIAAVSIDRDGLGTVSLDGEDS